MSGEYTSSLSSYKHTTVSGHVPKNVSDSSLHNVFIDSGLALEVLDDSPIGTIIIDSDNRIIWVNRAIEKFWGIKRRSVIGENYTHIINKKIKHLFENPEVLARRTIVSQTCPVSKDTLILHLPAHNRLKERWLEQWSRVIGKGANTGGRIEYFRDITSLKEMEHKFGSEKHKIENTINALEFGLTVCDRNLKILHQNDKFKKLFGGYNRKCYQVFCNSVSACTDCPVVRSFEDGQVHTSRQKYITPADEEYYYHLTSIPVKDNDGTVTSCFSIAIDYTPYLNIYSELKQSEEKYKITFENTSTAMIIVEEDMHQYRHDNRRRRYGHFAG